MDHTGNHMFSLLILMVEELCLNCGVLRERMENENPSMFNKTMDCAADPLLLDLLGVPRH
jgi:hypothetical protein